MALLKSFPPGGKKQAPMPGPNGAAHKKIAAAKKNAKSASGRGGKKGADASAAAFSSLESRQMLVERVKRQIWASVLKINDAIINLALAGNINAAKALFDFAGVYSLPEPENENVNVAPVTFAAAPEDASDPIEGFFRSIGVEPPNAQLEPDAIAAG